MTPQERLALALQYQKQRELGSALPSTPAENAARPVQEPEQSWLDKLNEAASGVGYGLGQQVEGLGQMARHPLDTLHSIAVDAGKAMDNPSAAAQAAWQGLKQSAGEAVSSPFNLGQAVGANVNINPRKLAAMLESPAVRELTAYHGTPHTYEPTEANPLGEFDASKIGTGEGAQAYGHGIYLAESPNVAEKYKQRLSSSSYSKDNALIDSGLIWHKAADAASEIGKLHPDNAGQISSQIMDWVDTGKKPETFLKFNAVSPKLKPAYEAALQEYAGAIKNRGSLYHVDLPDEMIDRMLDWDKPFLDQSQEIKDFAKTMLPPRVYDRVLMERTGDFLEALGVYKGGQAKAAELLRQTGIPGIRYLDQGSRAGGQGTRNFVVFPGEEKKVKILERK